LPLALGCVDIYTAAAWKDISLRSRREILRFSAFKILLNAEDAEEIRAEFRKKQTLKLKCHTA